jgi:hypothetical protein
LDSRCRAPERHLYFSGSLTDRTNSAFAPRSKNSDGPSRIFGYRKGDRVATNQGNPFQIRLDDGRMTPLEPDLVCQTLFALTEELGRPDAFLARELTDGVVYFLREEGCDTILSNQELSEQIIKCVRELGHPMMAQLLAARGDSIFGTPQDTANTNVVAAAFVGNESRSMTDDSVLPTSELPLAEVYPRDVVSLHHNGLLKLTGLAHPFQISGSVLGSPVNPEARDLDIGAAIGNARIHTAGFVAVDGPDIALARLAGSASELATQFVREVDRALAVHHLRAVVNLNQADPPAWAAPGRQGPLFSGLEGATEPARLQEVAVAIARQLLDGAGQVEVAWHLSSSAFQAVELSNLIKVLRSEHQDRRVTFVLDRSRQPQMLAPGLTRQHVGVLTAVGVQLDRLAQQISTVNPEQFLHKLGSLCRLARSAGHAKYDFLRKHGRAELTRGFLLERARLVVVPLGLEAAVRHIMSKPVSDGGDGTSFAAAIVECMHDALIREPPRNMDAALDEMPPVDELSSTAALSPSDPDSPPRQQIKAAGALHRIAGAGTAVIRVPEESAHTVEDIASWIRQAWHQTEVHRIRFVTQPPATC